MTFLTKLKEIWRGKDLYRILMNQECAQVTMRGKVVDIGSGLTQASYYRFLKKESGATIEPLDLNFTNQDKHIDLEKDQLPYTDNSVDTVLLFNVLEHLYNHRLVIAEIKRVLKPGGQLIGAVPFLVDYHPDPHDFWRYTRETLEKIFTETQFVDITIRSFGRGPFSAAFSHIEMVLPRIFKIIIVMKALACDWLIRKLRPKINGDKFPLGLFFTVKK